jgi:1-acyl-sn-glycerol-3-phosphate acyltransferase
MLVKYPRAILAGILMAFIFIGVCLRVIVIWWKKDHIVWFSRRLAFVGTKFLKIKMNFSARSHSFDPQVKIIISNHQNNFDMFPGSYSIPPDTVILGKRDLLWIPVFGLAYWMTGNILINRKNKKDAWTAIDEIQRKLIKEQKSLWMFPEGTRSKGRGLLPFKKGAFVLAIRAGLPIVPVCFSSYHKKIDLAANPSGQILITVLRPIETLEYKEEDEPKLRQKVWDLMKAEIDMLDQELLTT